MHRKRVFDGSGERIGKTNRKNIPKVKKKLNTNKETWFVPRSRNCEGRKRRRREG